MMLFPCPWCGPRDETEFVFGGESHVQRPSPPEAVDDRVWADYLFCHDNPRGLNFERWHHTYGCGQWFNIARDTVSHRIHAVYKMSDPKPEIP